MNRTQTILGSLLLVQIVLILVVRSPFSDASRGTASRPYLPVLEAVSPTRLALEGNDDARVTLAKKADRWVVEEAAGFPADQGKVDELIDSLKALTVRRPVVTSSRYHSAFKVTEDEFEGRVQLWGDPSDDPDVDLFLGTSPNYRAVHARLHGEEAVYEVRGIASYDVRGERASWIDKDFVESTQEQVVGLSVSNGQGTFEIGRQDGTWKVVSPESDREAQLDTGKIDSLVRAVTSLRFTDAAGTVDEAAQGLDSPAATVVVRWRPSGAEDPEGSGSTEPPREQTIRIGSEVQDKDTERYLTYSGSEFAGTVWKSSVTRLVEEGLDKLLPESG